MRKVFQNQLPWGLCKSIFIYGEVHRSSDSNKKIQNFNYSNNLCSHFTFLMKRVWYWNKPVEVGVVVKPVRQCARAVHGEALVEYMEGHILKSVVV